MVWCGVMPMVPELKADHWRSRGVEGGGILAGLHAFAGAWGPGSYLEYAFDCRLEGFFCFIIVVFDLIKS